MKPKKIVFLDLETTGLNPRVNEILEVGMIKRTLDEDGPPFVDQSIHFSLPIILDLAEEAALKVNRYHERREQLSAIEVGEDRAVEWLTRTLEDAIVVGNNIQFDLRFIEQFLLENTRWGANTTPWNYHPVDIKALAAGRLGMGPPPWTTYEVACEAGVPLPDDAHSAFVDATWNRDVYDAVMNYEPTVLPNGSVNPR